MAKKEGISFDKLRYQNELKLYRHLEKKDFSSISSSLIPLIISNESIEVAAREATQLFSFIRRDLKQKNRIGITMLCHFLFNLSDLETEFANFTMLGQASKEDEIAFQKEKINIILGKKTQIDVILEALEEMETEANRQLLEKIKEEDPDKYEQEDYRLMENYLIRLCNFEVAPPPVKAGFDIKNIIGLERGSQGFDPFIGKFFVLDKTEKRIKIQSKRGELSLNV